MTLFAVALGATSILVLPPAGLIALGMWIRSYRQGARLDRAGGGR